jgi:hypothetical protein
MLTVENVIPAALFSINGNVHLHEGPSTADLPRANPVNIIQKDQTLYAHFVWSQAGWLSKLLNPGNRWTCSVFVEQMGKGEVSSDPTPVSVAFKPITPGNYSATVAIPGNTLDEGAYKLVATLTLTGASGGPTPLAAYEELGILQVYED